MRIGITGHQRLEDAAAWSWVEASMVSAIVSFEPPWVAISSLAIGADQLFARLVGERGGAVHAVIPFPDYERTFASRDADLYHKALERAQTKEILRGMGNDEESYLAAGQRVVELSDRMIAVWDGSPAKGIGGTADIVDFALKRKVPVIHLNPVTQTLERI